MGSELLKTGKRGRFMRKTQGGAGYSSHFSHPRCHKTPLSTYKENKRVRRRPFDHLLPHCSMQNKNIKTPPVPTKSHSDILQIVLFSTNTLPNLSIRGGLHGEASFFSLYFTCLLPRRSSIATHNSSAELSNFRHHQGPTTK